MMWKSISVGGLHGLGLRDVAGGKAMALPETGITPEATNISFENCFTGESNPLLPHILHGLQNATRIDFLVAFLMESGVDLLIADLERAVSRGVPVRIICGNYMGITQPAALYQLRYCMGSRVSLCFYSDSGRSFHPKAWFFHYQDHSELYLGSSNASRSALTSGVEWNVRLDSRKQPVEVETFRQEYERIHSVQSYEIDDFMLRRYSLQYRDSARKVPLAAPFVMANSGESGRTAEGVGPTNRTDTGSEMTPYLAIPRASTIAPIQFGPVPPGQNPLSTTPFAPTVFVPTPVPASQIDSNRYIPKPNAPQTEALYSLKMTRLAGNTKALVVAATGVGKTYLAAFDSVGFKRVLFLAHREELLFQAEKTFRMVRPGDTTGFFTGDSKQPETDILFASVQTLGKPEYLTNSLFPQNRFDLVIVDEFHHAAADSYRRILDWFQPQFLLGVTATPERMDNREVFSLCDYNVVYDVRLKEAIEKCWLAPFHYYGVDDDTVSYEAIPFHSGQYDPASLEAALAIPRRAALVLQHFKRFSSRQCIAFCAGREHAAFMANEFKKANISACAIISDQSGIEYPEVVMNRTEALELLRLGKIRVIFAVDMLNEGVDIPSVDMLMFLRPTESGTIFLQQLGRGLRVSLNKAYVTVLDFIGNYRNVQMVPRLLTGDGRSGGYGRMPGDADWPEGCRVWFDWKVLDLFKLLEQRHSGAPVSSLAKLEYLRIRDRLEHNPSLREYWEQMEPEVWKRIKGSKAPANPMKDWLLFLSENRFAPDGEQRLLGTFGHDFLRMLANTDMTKTYKMPLLLAFHRNGRLYREAAETDIHRSFRDFYGYGLNGEDLLQHMSTRDFRSWGAKEFIQLARQNPIRYLLQSASRFFRTEGSSFLLASELEPWLDDDTFVQLYLDIVTTRTMRYYRERMASAEFAWYGDAYEH